MADGKGCKYPASQKRKGDKLSNEIPDSQQFVTEAQRALRQEIASLRGLLERTK